MKTTLFMLLCSNMIAQAAWADDIPQFADYPVKVMQLATQHAPRLADLPMHAAPFSTDFHPSFVHYKSYLSFAMDGDAVKLFAGHYRISEWGCGTGCQQSAIIDNSTGHVYGYFQTDTSIAFRADSRLLIVNPKLDADVINGYQSDQHTSYWLWNGHGFDALTP